MSKNNRMGALDGTCLPICRRTGALSCRSAAAGKVAAGSPSVLTGTIEFPFAQPTTTFSLDPERAEITPIVRGVRRQQRADGFAFAFDADHLICFFHHGVVFVGGRGNEGKAATGLTSPHDCRMLTARYASEFISPLILRADGSIFGRIRP